MPRPAVDFGGKPAGTYQWNMAQNIKPKASGFALISSAYASDMPMSSCGQISHAVQARY